MDEQEFDCNGSALSPRLILEILDFLADGGTVRIKNIGLGEYQKDSIQFAKDVLSLVQRLNLTR